MIKLVLLSVVLAQVALPLLAARDASPRRGLKRALLSVVLFNAFFAFCLRVVIPRLG